MNEKVELIGIDQTIEVLPEDKVISLPVIEVVDKVYIPHPTSQGISYWTAGFVMFWIIGGLWAILHANNKPPPPKTIHKAKPFEVTITSTFVKGERITININRKIPNDDGRIYFVYNPNKTVAELFLLRNEIGSTTDQFTILFDSKLDTVIDSLADELIGQKVQLDLNRFKE